jgi:hypothetical protein
LHYNFNVKTRVVVSSGHQNSPEAWSKSCLRPHVTTPGVSNMMNHGK